LSNIKSVLLASAAGFVAIAGAQAADLPLKAKAVEYVKVCSLYGAGFYYIPGTDTCIKYSGFIRYEQNYNANASGAKDTSTSGTPGTGGLIASGNWNRDYFTQRIRVAWQTDTRTQTEYGTLRSYSYLYLTSWSSPGPQAGAGSNPGGALATTPTLLQGYIQFAGFTVGTFKSAFFTPWSSNPGNYNGSLFSPDDAGAVMGSMYTWQFGNGVSASIEATASRRAGIYGNGTFLNANPINSLTPSVGGATSGSSLFSNSSISGTHIPDIVGNIQINQAWGTFHIGAVAHAIEATYYSTPFRNAELNGHPSTKWGYGVNLGLNLKQLPTGAGDQLFLNFAYTDGATGYQKGNSPPTGIALYGGGSPGFYNSVGWTYLLDGVYSGANGSSIHTVKMGTAMASFEHYWIPGKLKSSLYGYYSWIDYDNASNTVLCNKINTQLIVGSNMSCNFDTNIWTIGSRTTWYPVKDLEVALMVDYSQFDFKSSGSIIPAASLIPGVKPSGVAYNIKDQGVLSGALRVVRTW
jgi:hypothetical protein